MRGRTNAAIVALAVTGIAILANVLGLWFFGRSDLTRNSRYSLSDVSREAVAALDGLEVQVYISGDLPVSMLYQGREIPIRGVDREFRDKLAEFRSWSNNGMKISFVRKNVEEAAARARLELFTWKDAQIENGRLEFRKYAMGAVFSYRNQIEVLPIVTDPDFLEFEITRILVRLADKWERASTMEKTIAAARKIQDGGRACFERLDKLEKTPATGIGAMIGVRQTIRERLSSDLPSLARACGALGSATAAAGQQAGSNEQLDALLRSAGQFQELIDRLLAILSPGRDGVSKDEVTQLFESAVRAYMVMDSDASNLLNMPSRKLVAFLCSGRSFCPFAEEGQLIEPAVSSALAARNPDFAPLLSSIEKIQSQMDVINNGLRMGMFENRGIDLVPVRSGQPVPDDAEALVVFGPERPLSDKDRYTVDQFLLSGRSVIVFVNNWNMSLFNIDESGDFSQGIPIATPSLQSNASNISAMLENYGVKVNGDLLVGLKSFADLNLSQMSSRESQASRAGVPYPLLPYLTELDKSHVLVRNIPGIALPYATTLSTTPDSADLEISRLVGTSSDVARTFESVDILPNRLTSSLSGMKPGSPAPVALAVTGRFKSAFDNAPQGVAEGATGHLSEGNGRLLVVGSSMGLENLSRDKIFDGFSFERLTNGMLDPMAETARYASRFQNWQMRLSQLSGVVAADMGFVFNCLDWGVMNDALVDIRSKAADRRPVDQLAPGTMVFVQVVFIVGLPLLFAMAGLIRNRIRRHRH